MPVNFQLQSLTFSDASKIDVPSDSIIIIVGPNNVGKSCVLREIHQIVTNGHGETEKIRKVIKNASCETIGTSDELSTYLSENTITFTDANGATFYRSLQTNIHGSKPQNLWNNFNANGFKEMANLFITFADTVNRLRIIEPPETFNRLQEVPQHPIHTLLLDDSIEKILSDHIRQAFGEDLVLNRGVGKILPLHIGEIPPLSKGEDRISTSYIEKIMQIPLAHEQGDGIKSFIGCLLSTIILSKPLTLLDEPEAFLHPPQARLLGSLLANHHKEKQLLVATHSGDILRGVLDANPSNLTILRITRKGDKNIPNKLDPNDIKAFWSDTILRHSNILDGLFHEAVIICESDADCRFYSALMSSIYEDSKKQSTTLSKKPDVLFIPAGGHGRITKISIALSKIKVNTFSIVDFDILQDHTALKNLYEAFGGTWAYINDDYEAVKGVIDKLEPPCEITEIVSNIRQILNDIESTGEITSPQQSLINQHIRSAKGWSKAKTHGMEIFSDHEAVNKLNDLLRKLKSVNIWIVPWGQLESFDRSIGKHGPKWVIDVLEKGVIEDQNNLQNARSFLAELMKSL